MIECNFYGVDGEELLSDFQSIPDDTEYYEIWDLTDGICVGWRYV